MRSSAVLVAVLAAVASAQSSATVPQLPTPTGGDPVQSSIAAKINDCLKACDPTDTTCQAKCVDVPAPNEDQVNETIACSTKCDQGDGSPEDTEAFGQCLAKCRDQHYFSQGAGTPEATGGSGSGSGSGSAQTTSTGAAATTGTSSGDNASETADSTNTDASSSGSSTDSAAESSETSEPNGAATLSFSAASIFGVVAAFFL